MSSLFGSLFGQQEVKSSLFSSAWKQKDTAPVNPPPASQQSDQQPASGVKEKKRKASASATLPTDIAQPQEQTRKKRKGKAASNASDSSDEEDVPSKQQQQQRQQKQKQRAAQAKQHPHSPAVCHTRPTHAPPRRRVAAPYRLPLDLALTRGLLPLRYPSSSLTAAIQDWRAAAAGLLPVCWPPPSSSQGSAQQQPHTPPKL
eukprot:CAMPEP_0202376130 /NCGR_PEP_ID=MMETSP1127-20130417/6687_1 /ASSEMBLY_ACC=CAM_ASM_000462 /TAXON_ID=3047 /ORGANISM="Dunaliella tertiolecta, Strain CCMP1320" /LENGTH=201 /DNA_ID=CAMNT_0048973829 /DNA_START=66 /DNA_END=668 /DNA_ORIENTATION=-